jgi:hypothetical protein
LYWTRRGVAAWIATELATGAPALLGIDHAFSFPLRYFATHALPPDWPSMLDDFRHHWPTDEDDVSVDHVRDGHRGHGAARAGDSRWRRLTEVRSRAKSAFHFDVPGSVAKSTHAGLPWLRHLRRELGPRVHFWPFDGWVPPPDRSVIAEAYPALWSRAYPAEERTPDQHDAYAIARWARDTDAAGGFPAAFQPTLTPADRATANLEGWILGLG